MNKDVQLKTLANIWQVSRQPHLADRVIWTEQLWYVTRYLGIKINILIIDIIIVTTIITIIIFVVRALSTITKKTANYRVVVRHFSVDTTTIAFL